VRLIFTWQFDSFSWVKPAMPAAIPYFDSLAWSGKNFKGQARNSVAERYCLGPAKLELFCCKNQMFLWVAFIFFYYLSYY